TIKHFHLGIGYKPFDITYNADGTPAVNVDGTPAVNVVDWTDIISTNIDGWGLDVFTVTKGSFLNISNPANYVSPTGIGTEI
ncbi:MAG: hypothetical protein RR405_06355, partial [Clostridia bacterium]